MRGVYFNCFSSIFATSAGVRREVTWSGLLLTPTRESFMTGALRRVVRKSRRIDGDILRVGAPSGVTINVKNKLPRG